VKRRAGTANVTAAAAIAGICAILGYISYFWSIGFGATLIYPATGVQFVAGIWFGAWGAFGGWLGSLIGNAAAGTPIFPVYMAYGWANLITGLLPAILVRYVIKADISLKKARDYALIIGVCIIPTVLIEGAYGNLALYAIGYVAPELLWPWTLVWWLGDWAACLIFGLPLLKVASKAMMRSRAYTVGLLS